MGNMHSLGLLMFLLFGFGTLASTGVILASSSKMVDETRKSGIEVRDIIRLQMRRIQLEIRADLAKIAYILCAVMAIVGLVMFLAQ